MIKTFVEIGTCDFDTNIKLANNGDWKGIMVEPSPLIYNNLADMAMSSNFPNNLKILNCAISDRDGVIEFAIAKEKQEEGNEWARGIGTVVDPNHKGTNLYTLGDNAELLYDRVIEVPCMTLDTLVMSQGLKAIDYLKLDTEGHEATILNAYSWSVLPTFIKLEHFHIDDVAMKALLESKGYLVYTEAQDMYAIR